MPTKSQHKYYTNFRGSGGTRVCFYTAGDIILFKQRGGNLVTTQEFTLPEVNKSYQLVALYNQEFIVIVTRESPPKINNARVALFLRVRYSQETFSPWDTLFLYL